MSSPAKISMCTQQDYNQILDELQEFWGARDTRHLHHPFLVHEFGNSAFVIRNGAQVVAYLFGFLSQTEPVGYVHTVAVRTSARRQGLAGELFGHFVEFARRHGCRHVKAITTPANLGSIAFHKSLGMGLLGDANSDGIPALPDYAGPRRSTRGFLEIDLEGHRRQHRRMGCTSLGPRSRPIRPVPAYGRNTSDGRPSPSAGNPVRTQVFGLRRVDSRPH